MSDEPIGSNVPQPSRIAAETPWYDLFSRGARDWLRHNEKVRDAVKASLPDLVAGPDILTRPGDRTVLVPVRLLEHARFRLADPEARVGAGQGEGKPGDILRPARPQAGEDEGRGTGGNEDGEVQFVLELKIDDIMDWLWEELKLPDLQLKQSATIEDSDLIREGWDKHGPRARLDRRRTVKEAVKRRAIQEDAVPFTNEDLRFRQLVRRQRPALNAVVMFALDVSGSIGEAQRKLAKTFFFFALHGIRREYAKVETVFLAHTTDAWEFSEEQFFRVSGTGGTVSSSVFRLSVDLLKSRYDPSRYNSYLFYASDGENYSEDREAAREALSELASMVNYVGYVELQPASGVSAETEMARLCGELQHEGLPVGMSGISGQEDIWQAIRRLFLEEAGQQGGELTDGHSG